MNLSLKMIAVTIYTSYILLRGFLMTKRSGEKVLFAYRDKNTTLGVTRETVLSMAEKLGTTETGVIHLALARLAIEADEMYPIDDGPITKKQGARIQKLADQKRGSTEFVPTDHLFDNVGPT